MATASLLSIDINDVTTPVVIPDDDVARLMYYLRCVTVGVKLFILDNDLVDYKNYMRLPPTRRAVVFQTALRLSPDTFMDKFIFQRDDIEFEGTNRFCKVSVACDIVSLQQHVFIAGHMQDVTQIMLFKSSWLDYYYTRPMERAVSGTHHCSHCPGGDGLCTCDRCPRRTDSRCQPPMNHLIGPRSHTVISSPSSHSTPAASAKLRMPRTPRTPHTANKATPAHRPPQPTPAPPKPKPKSKLKSKPKPTPKLPSHSRATTVSPYFYNDMTVSELRKYLSDCGIAYKDIPDRETLCHRAWETHCERMSKPELRAFLKEHNISTFFRSAARCRQKAKDTFQIN